MPKMAVVQEEKIHIENLAINHRLRIRGTGGGNFMIRQNWPIQPFPDLVTPNAGRAVGVDGGGQHDWRKLE